MVLASSCRFFGVVLVCDVISPAAVDVPGGPEDGALTAALAAGRELLTANLLAQSDNDPKDWGNIVECTVFLPLSSGFPVERAGFMLAFVKRLEPNAMLNIKSCFIQV